MRLDASGQHGLQRRPVEVQDQGPDVGDVGLGASGAVGGIHGPKDAGTAIVVAPQLVSVRVQIAMQHVGQAAILAALVVVEGLESDRLAFCHEVEKPTGGGRVRAQIGLRIGFGAHFAACPEMLFFHAA